MSEAKKEFELVVRWHGRADSEMIRAAAKHVTTFHIWKDSKARLVTFEEYKQLIADGLVNPEYSWGASKEGEVCAVSLGGYYNGYSTTWDLVSTAKGDFEAGWNACEAKYKMLRDWEEAIEHDKARTDYAKIMMRNFKIDLTGTNFHWSICDELTVPKYAEIKKVIHRGHRDGAVWLTVTAKTTGDGLHDLAQRLYCEFGFNIEPLPYDPRQTECKQSYGWDGSIKKSKGVKK